jgi:hypothetical protein
MAFHPETVLMQKSLLFIPGPVACSEPVLAAMAKPLINHRGPEYARLLHSIADRMQSIFATKGDVLLMGSSGTGSLEAAVTNMFGPGDTLLACPTGAFGERIAAIAKMWGCTVEILETPWGAGVDPQTLAAWLRADREKKITGILLTHNETSTGVQRSRRDVARDRGSSRVRRRRLGERLRRERIQDGRVEARYRLRCVAKSARVSAWTCDGCGELTRVGEDQSEQGATFLFRFTEAQRVFR